MKEKNNNFIVRIITIVATCVTILGTYFILMDSGSKKKSLDQTSNQSGHVNIGGDFTLINSDGHEENTVKYKDKYKLVYFGFTYCPDICPTALSNISNIIDITEKYGIDIVPIFVTIDPRRDTIDVMKAFCSHFNPKIIGYTGDENSIKNVADLFKVFYAKVPRSDASEDDYLMDHSSLIYFMSKDMKFIKHFASEAPAMEVADYIRRIISETKN
ncbi:MAG: SCO family protein [Rickettsiaceae bacterium]|nr:SCO family protein [Rickettsiaceae bacterium]